MIEYRDNPEAPWKTSDFPWLPEDIGELNSFVGWPMYRQIEEAA